MNKRRFTRSRTIPSKSTREHDLLYKDTLKKVQKTNQRIKSLSKKTGSKGWAYSKLNDRLNDIMTSAGIIRRLKPNTSITQLRNINKATTQFLTSKTSTKKGLSDVKSKVKESLAKELDLDDIDVDDAYDMLSDNDFDYFNEKIGSSDMWAVIDESVAHNDTEESFIKRLSTIIDVSNDLDIRDKAINLYNKYVNV